jgi:hypothetical protein
MEMEMLEYCQSSVFDTICSDQHRDDTARNAFGAVARKGAGVFVTTEMSPRKKPFASLGSPRLQESH